MVSFAILPNTFFSVIRIAHVQFIGTFIVVRVQSGSRFGKNLFSHKLGYDWSQKENKLTMAEKPKNCVIKNAFWLRILRFNLFGVTLAYLT